MLQQDRAPFQYMNWWYACLYHRYEILAHFNVFVNNTLKTPEQSDLPLWANYWCLHLGFHWQWAYIILYLWFCTLLDGERPDTWLHTAQLSTHQHRGYRTSENRQVQRHLCLVMCYISLFHFFWHFSPLKREKQAKTEIFRWIVNGVICVSENYFQNVAHYQ